MYISQEPQKNIINKQIPDKRKNKASLAVFFVNLLLMAAAFFAIKNEDKNRIEKQKDENIDTQTATDSISEAENNTDLNNGASAEIIAPETSKKTDPPAASNTNLNNVGVSKTAPVAQITAIDNSASNTGNTADKKSTKTRTS